MSILTIEKPIENTKSRSTIVNVVFISPHFPLYFHNFCSRLKERGANVLGIGDENYNLISRETKESLTEYYKVSNLKNLEEVKQACEFYENKYGKINWIESQNEYWLETEANLRSEFNVSTGTKIENMGSIKYKSKMKSIYEKAGVPVARYNLVTTFENSLEFIKDVGYPVVVKPDNGVGALSTYKLNNYDDLTHFFETKNDNILYIMEEFDTRSRFFHFEFFRLDKDKEGLGKKGDIVGLEVNMRAPGAYMPDMINYTYDIDIYSAWADMLIYDKSFINVDVKYCVKNEIYI